MADTTSYSDQFQESVETGRERIAHGLDEGARRMREGLERMPGGQRMSGAARKAADKLSGAASYLNEHSTSEMVEDVRSLIRRNPGQALIAAAALGFAIGMAMKSGRD